MSREQERTKQPLPSPTRPSTSPPRVLVMAASTRSVSINQALARLIMDRLTASGESAELIDLSQSPMPLYDGDLEERNGVPPAASRLVDVFKQAEILVIVSPEYNGSFTPLLKNTVDWMTRVDKTVLAHLNVLLAAASPGASGGMRGLEMVRLWMSNIGVDVAPRTLTIGSVKLSGDGDLTGIDSDRLDQFTRQVLTEQPSS